MRYCENCFNDPVIKDIILQSPVVENNDCPLCKCKAASIHEIQDDSIIRNLLANVIGIYQPVTEKTKGGYLIAHYFANHWNIFNRRMSQWQIRQLLCTIFATDTEILEKMEKKLILLEEQNPKYMKENAIFRTGKWEDFATNIKHINRFHLDEAVNLPVLRNFLESAIKIYPKGKAFYRARKCDGKIVDVKAPPQRNTMDGRVNSKGIRCLYVSDAQDTTLYEIRAVKHDNVTIGCLQLKRNVRVVDLSALAQVSPFAVGDDMSMYAVNIDNLKRISEEIGRPVNSDSAEGVLEYLPTQYIAYYIKQLGLDGVEFKSAMRGKGYNIALFDTNVTKCTQKSLYKIKDTKYTKQLMTMDIVNGNDRS